MQENLDIFYRLRHERAMQQLGLAERNKDDNRAAFVRAACALSLAPNADNDTVRAFAAVTEQVREIASQLDPPGRDRYRRGCYNKENNRDALCGRLSVLLAENPEAGKTVLTDEQRRLAATVLGLAVVLPEPAAEPEEAEEENEEEEVCAAPAEMSSWRKDLWRNAANLALAGLGYAVYVDAIPILAVTAAALGAGLVSRWGQPALRNVVSALTDDKHVGAIRRALSDYSSDIIGRERTASLRDYFVRYITMDANALSQLLAATYPQDPERNTINALLLSEIRRRVENAAPGSRDADINGLIGRVLADFTFGQSGLINRMDVPSVTAFIPTAGLEHVGLRGAKDQPEFLSLKNAFATNWFKPTRPIEQLDEVPEDIVSFWSHSLASALDQERPNAVPDSVLYTMYYFVWRYVDAYRLLEKLHCPSAQTQHGRLRNASGRALSSATSSFQCIFEDYERRYRESLTWTDAFKYHLGLD
jgi:hypothetical protein